MDEVKTYQYGNTIRLECIFYDFNNEPADPDFIKVVIYDESYNILVEDSGTRDSIGRYYYDYETEGKVGKYYYEWFGEFDGKPSLRRNEFFTKFV